LYTPIVKDTGRSGLGNGPEEVCDFSKKYRFLSKWCKDKHDWAEIQANDRPFGFLDHNVPHLIQKEQEMDVDPTDDEDANHEEDGSNKNATTTIDIRVQLLQQYSGTYSVETVPGGNTQQRQLHVQGDDFLFLWKGNNTRLCHLFRAMHQVMNDDVYLEQVVRDGNAGNGTTAAAARALLKDANKSAMASATIITITNSRFTFTGERADPREGLDKAIGSKPFISCAWPPPGIKWPLN